MRRNAIAAAAVACVQLGIAAWMWAPGSAAAMSGFAPAVGSLWVKISYARWTADERFAGPFNAEDLHFRGGREPGDRVPIKVDAETSEFSHQSVGIDLRYAPIARLTAGAHLPVYQRTAFRQDEITVITEGTGDLFAFVGFQLTPLDLTVLGSSLVLHVKLPLSEARFEDLSVPLSEGQVDIALEQVTTWAPLSRLHLSGRLLYRHRFEVEQEVGGSVARIVPGNETELGLEVAGGPVPWLWLRAGYEALFAAAAQDRSVPSAILATEQRQLHRLDFGAYLHFGTWIHEALDGLALDTWLRYPVAGQDMLAGLSFGAGLAYGWGD